MEAKNKIEIALRAGMLAFDILSLQKESSALLMRLTMRQVAEEFEELNKIIKTLPKQ